jgi:hypothetical protein
MVGKYLGIVAASALGVILLGAVLVLGTWYRIPSDYLLNANTLNDIVGKQIRDLRLMHISGLFPQLMLSWLEICVLAAVGVALSTRFSLVVNLPAVIILYFVGNLMRFVFPINNGPLSDKPQVVKAAAWVLGLLLPALDKFDLRDMTLLSNIRVPHTAFAADTHGVPLSALWLYVAVAALYAICYIAFVLCAGMFSFQNRELGGGEG